MGKQLHRDSSLIDAITPGVVRREFSLSHQRLRNWRLRGIPETNRVAFVNLAARHAVAVPSDFLTPRDQRVKDMPCEQQAAA